MICFLVYVIRLLLLNLQTFLTAALSPRWKMTATLSMTDTMLALQASLTLQMPVVKSEQYVRESGAKEICMCIIELTELLHHSAVLEASLDVAG